MENSTFNEYNLRQMSIYDLRNFARESGVSSPTIYKKEELIEKVINILKGEEKPHVRKTMQGRPPKAPNFQKNAVKKQVNNFKRFFGESEKEGFISEFSLLKDSSYRPEEAKYILNNPFKNKKEYIDDYKTTLITDYSEDENIIESEGYVFSLNEDNSFVLPKERSIDSVKSIYITKSDMQKHNLKSGDYVKCLFKIVDIDKTRLFVNLINKEKKSLESNTLNQKNSMLNGIYLLENFVNIDNVKINTVIVKKPTKTFEISNSIYSNDKNLKILKVFLQLSGSEINKLNNEYECFYTLENDTANQNLNILKLAVDRAKRLSESGYNVLIVVNDINKIINSQNILNEYGLFEIKENSMNKCFELNNIKKQQTYCKSINIVSLFEYEPNIEFYKIIYKLLEDDNCNFIKM